MIRILFFALICLNFQAINAQTPLSEKEQLILKTNVQKNAKQTQTIVSDFVQTKEMEFLNDVAESKGKLIFKSPDKIRWEYISPYPYTVIFKEDKLFVNDDGKKSDMDLSSNKMFRSFNKLIIGSIQGDMFDEEAFDISYFKTEENYMVNFITKEKGIRKFIASFQLTFDKNTSEVLQVKMTEPSGDFTTIVFKNRKENTSVLDSVFSF